MRADFQNKKPQPKSDSVNSVIYGRNSVLEALKSKQPIEKIYFSNSVKRETIGAIFSLAKEQKIPISEAAMEKFQKAGLRDVSHQGIYAIISPVTYTTLEDFIETAHKESCVAILDELEDPHNIGAIIRSAEIFGFNAVILPFQNSAPITQTVVKSSAGAIFHIPIIKVGNLNKCIEDLKVAGFWIYGLEANGENLTPELRLNFPIGIVVGSEGKGLRPLIRKNCDSVLSIQQKGKINSLNASVAAGIVFWEVSKRF